MPISSYVDAEERLRYFVCSGNLCDRELIEAFGRSADAADFDVPLDGLVDLRAVGNLQVTPGGVSQLAQILRATGRCSRRMRVAIVAPTDFRFGMARMAVILLAIGGVTTECRAFREMGDAHAWLRRAASGDAATTAERT
jgi:hypothetical protein